MAIVEEEYYMREALRQASMALEDEEIPIGAVIVTEQGKIIGKGYNQTEKLNDVTAHAEMLAITAAANALGAKYLKDCTIYVTIEPCPMCAAALQWAQISCVVYGATDDKRGYSLFSPPLLHPKTIVKQGLMEKECGQLMKDFFVSKR